MALVSGLLKRVPKTGFTSWETFVGSSPTLLIIIFFCPCQWAMPVLVLTALAGWCWSQGSSRADVAGLGISVLCTNTKFSAS
ncbi:hypothetical protein B0J12DRAFT_161775 [Macrophomina phaseolina]|uniref:Uncharacterized protein n=1 Tax=Macrophomina phaseolina TaxID=35725 RepID=A0ABQ8GRU4_9PEZI|nr:hypothetical protein B0J12DRAFT_161775 [Macrophomina phaseolina]